MNNSYPFSKRYGCTIVCHRFSKGFFPMKTEKKIINFYELDSYTIHFILCIVAIWVVNILKEGCKVSHMFVKYQHTWSAEKSKVGRDFKKESVVKNVVNKKFTSKLMFFFQQKKSKRSKWLSPKKINLENKIWHFLAAAGVQNTIISFKYVCWFLAENLASFISLPWKFDNPY